MKRAEYAKLKVQAVAEVETGSGKPVEWIAGRLVEWFESPTGMHREAAPEDLKQIRRAANKALRTKLGIPPNRSGSAPTFCVCANEDELNAMKALSEKDGTSKAGQFHLGMRIYFAMRKKSDWKKRLEAAFPGLQI